MPNQVPIRMRNAVAISGLLLAGGLLLAAPALAAPTGETAQQTISKLKADGYKVIVSKTGNAALNDCSVTAVRPGRDVVRNQPNQWGDNRPVVAHTTVHVDLACQR